MKNLTLPARKRARGPLPRLAAVTALLTAAALGGSNLQALAAVAPADQAGSVSDAQYRQDQCFMSGVLRMGGPAMKQLAATALDGTPDQLHAAVDTDTRNHSTPLHDAYLADSKAVQAKADQLSVRHKDWEAPLASIQVPGGFQSVADFRWAPGSPGDQRGDFFEQTGLGPWLGKRMWTSESDIGKVATPAPTADTLKAAKALGDSRYGGPWPDPSGPDYLRQATEHVLWDQDNVGFSLSADDTRLFLQNGGFPRSAPEPGTAEFRVAVEDLKTRYASCDSSNPDKVDANKVLGTEVRTATTEWQAEIAGQQVQRDRILAATQKATAALQTGSQALGEALAQSWLADHLSRWQAYWLPGGKGTEGSGPIVFHLHTAAGNCLDVSGSNPANGTVVQAWGCNSSAAQQWRPTPTGALVNSATNKCLDVDGGHGPQVNGTKVQIWGCNGTGSQQWQLAATNGGTTLYNLGSKLCLDLHTANQGQATQVWSCNRTGAQQFDAQQDNGGTGTGTDSLSYPKPAEFDAVNKALAAAQQAAKVQWDLAKQQAPIAQQAAKDTKDAQAKAYAIADAAGQPRGRGLLAGQQEAQATLASAAALDAVVKATETTYNATTASGANSQTLQQLAQTQLHAAQAAFRSTAAQAAADQAKAAADGSAQQAAKAAQAAKDAQTALTTVQGAEQSAKQAAATAKAKRAAAEAAQATAADAKNKAAAAQAKADTDRGTAQSKADAAVKAADAAKAAGATAAQKRSDAQTADKAAQDARRKAWEAEQAHNALAAKADAAEADAAAKAAGPDAQAAKDAADAADADATTAQNNADASSAAADRATADARTADAEATRAEGAAAQAQSDASAANAAKAVADQAVRTGQSAVADARAASDRAAADADAAQKDAATAQAQADSARSNAIAAWAQAGQAQATAASAAGFAYATAQAAGAASASAQQVAASANDAVQLGAPYQDTDVSAGLAVLTGQATKTIAEQQQAVAQLKADQAKQAADQAAALANAATGDAQAASRAAAAAAASAAAAKSSAKDALASSATAAQALADALASQARTVDYDSQAAGDAAAASAAAKGAAGDAHDARASAVAAADDADKAKVAASDAQSAAATAREVAAQAAKDADAAAAAAKDAQTQAAAAQESAVNAEKLAAADQAAKALADGQKSAADQRDLVQSGGATGIQRVFTQQTVTQLGDPTPDGPCVLGVITSRDSGCDVTFTVKYNVRVDYYLQLPTIGEPASDIPGPAAYYNITWLGADNTVVTKKTTQHFSAISLILEVDKAVLVALAESIAHDADECNRSHGLSPACTTALNFLPGGKAAKGAEMALEADKAITTGVDLEKVLADVKLADIEDATKAQLERDLQQAEEQLASCATNSFPGDTQVLLADGSHRAISAVRPGDQVLATDPADGSTRAEPVTAAFSHGTQRLVTVGLEGGGRLDTTAWHRVYVAQRGWTFAVDLHAGDQVRRPDGSTRTVTSTQDRAGLASTEVYDLTVEGLHSFYVLAGQSPVLVHNAFCPEVDTVANDWAAKGLHAKMSTGEEVSFFGVPTADGGFEIQFRPSFGKTISGKAAKDAAAALKNPKFRKDMLKKAYAGLGYLKQNSPGTNEIPKLENLIRALGGTP
ncbi:ricin-type beta-trefoil lectin domain protein [Kitasatospora sp. NPDC002227]|uniref:ricin-type beta-trefoil lectin domain protein n=1 Tax=Kitasatospora sp. NPDC002227 TaxID=3154773 RepID=UPI00331AC339